MYDQNFYMGAIVVDGEGINSKICLKGSGGGWGIIRNLPNSILK